MFSRQTVNSDKYDWVQFCTDSISRLKRSCSGGREVGRWRNPGMLGTTHRRQPRLGFNSGKLLKVISVVPRQSIEIETSQQSPISNHQTISLAPGCMLTGLRCPAIGIGEIGGLCGIRGLCGICGIFQLRSVSTRHMLARKAGVSWNAKRLRPWRAASR